MTHRTGNFNQLELKRISNMLID